MTIDLDTIVVYGESVPKITRRGFLGFLAAMIPASMLPASMATANSDLIPYPQTKVITQLRKPHINGIVHNAKDAQANLINRLYSNSFNKINFNSKDYGVVAICSQDADS